MQRNQHEDTKSAKTFGFSVDPAAIQSMSSCNRDPQQPPHLLAAFTLEDYTISRARFDDATVKLPLINHVAAMIKSRYTHEHMSSHEYRRVFIVKVVWHGSRCGRPIQKMPFACLP